MRIRDWSSDVCSSDLSRKAGPGDEVENRAGPARRQRMQLPGVENMPGPDFGEGRRCYEVDPRLPFGQQGDIRLESLARHGVQPERLLQRRRSHASSDTGKAADFFDEIGSAHVRTPAPNAHL